MSESHWVAVLGYEGKYEVSRDGEVRSLIAKRPLLVMRQTLRKDGYLQVQLKVKQVPCNRLVHTLVDEGFNGAREAGKVVNHIDGDKTNNKIENLERVSQKDNIRHAWRMGLVPKRFGESNPMAHLSDAVRDEIRSEPVEFKNGRLKRGIGVNLAMKYGVSRAYVCKLITDSRRACGEKNA